MMDVLTKDGVVIEIGAAITEVNDQQRYIINDRVYAGGSYRLHQNVDVPEFVKAGAYMYDGTGFAKYSGYFIHDNTSEESASILQAIDHEVPVIDYFADYERNSRLQGIGELPCFIQRLQFAPSNEQQVLLLVRELTADLAKTKQALAKVQENQNMQETMMIECFTDLDASINGGDGNAALE